MGDYQLKFHMFTIEMSKYDAMHRGKWLQTMGLITMDFK